MRERQSPNLEIIARPSKKLSSIRVRTRTYLTYLRENPAWLPMFILGRWTPAREAHWLTAKAAPSSSPQSTIFAGVTRDSAVQALRRDGLFTGLNLSKEICAEIADFAAKNTCFGNSDRKLEFLPDEHRAAERRFNQGISSGIYFEKLRDCPAALAVERDPLLRDIAVSYLGGQAQLKSTRIFWNFPTKNATHTDKYLDKYHFDLLDWRMVKFFFYLRPVDEGAGPHVYVRGSHRRHALRHQFTPFVWHPVDDVLRAYGADKPVTLLGDAGFGFVEDPFGFHMATVAKRTPRLVMEIAFGVSPPSRRRFHGSPAVK